MDSSMDCHDLQSKSRNDKWARFYYGLLHCVRNGRMLDSSGNALSPSLRGVAEAIHKNDKKSI